MMRCDKLVDVGRRQFLRGSAIATAGAAAATVMPSEHAQALAGGAVLDYPTKMIGSVKTLKVNEPVDIEFPDKDSPGVLLKLGKAVEGGVGTALRGKGRRQHVAEHGRIRALAEALAQQEFGALVFAVAHQLFEGERLRVPGGHGEHGLRRPIPAPGRRRNDRGQGQNRRGGRKAAGGSA